MTSTEREHAYNSLPLSNGDEEGDSGQSTIHESSKRGQSRPSQATAAGGRDLPRRPLVSAKKSTGASQKLPKANTHTRDAHDADSSDRSHDGNEDDGEEDDDVDEEEEEMYSDELTIYSSKQTPTSKGVQENSLPNKHRSSKRRRLRSPDDANIECDEDDDDEAPSDHHQKKRDRPREVASSEPDEEDDDVLEPPQKKSRTAKNPKDSSKGASRQGTEEKKRKRGRPPGSRSKSTKASRQATGERRGRGRPPGAKNKKTLAMEARRLEEQEEEEPPTRRRPSKGPNRIVSPPRSSRLHGERDEDEVEHSEYDDSNEEELLDDRTRPQPAERDGEYFLYNISQRRPGTVLPETWRKLPKPLSDDAAAEKPLPSGSFPNQPDTAYLWSESDEESLQASWTDLDEKILQETVKNDGSEIRMWRMMIERFDCIPHDLFRYGLKVNTLASNTHKHITVDGQKLMNPYPSHSTMLKLETLMAHPIWEECGRDIRYLRYALQWAIRCRIKDHDEPVRPVPYVKMLHDMPRADVISDDMAGELEYDMLNSPDHAFSGRYRDILAIVQYDNRKKKVPVKSNIEKQLFVLTPADITTVMAALDRCSDHLNRLAYAKCEDYSKIYKKMKKADKYAPTDIVVLSRWKKTCQLASRREQWLRAKWRGTLEQACLLDIPERDACPSYHRRLSASVQDVMCGLVSIDDPAPRPQPQTRSKGGQPASGEDAQGSFGEEDDDFGAGVAKYVSHSGQRTEDDIEAGLKTMDLTNWSKPDQKDSDGDDLMYGEDLPPLPPPEGCPECKTMDHNHPSHCSEHPSACLCAPKPGHTADECPMLCRHCYLIGEDGNHAAMRCTVWCCMCLEALSDDKPHSHCRLKAGPNDEIGLEDEEKFEEARDRGCHDCGERHLTQDCFTRWRGL